MTTKALVQFADFSRSIDSYQQQVCSVIENFSTLPTHEIPKLRSMATLHYCSYVDLLLDLQVSILQDAKPLSVAEACIERIRESMAQVQAVIDLCDSATQQP
jgi:hypothetical protein